MADRRVHGAASGALSGVSTGNMPKINQRLTPALLDKAFRGELVLQDANDEPASVLLERLRAARPAPAARMRRAVSSKGTP